MFNRIQKHKSSSSALIIETIYQLKGTEVMMYLVELMHSCISTLEKVNKVATKPKQSKKKCIQKKEVLTKRDRENILAQKKANQQDRVNSVKVKNNHALAARLRHAARGRRETGHNLRTCKNDTVDIA